MPLGWAAFRTAADSSSRVISQWGAFLSRGFVDSHGFPFHALVLRARRA